MKNNLSNYCLLVLLCIGFNFAFGQNPARELSSLIDMRATYLDKELEDRGYKFVKTDKSGSDAYSYWWNNRRNKCITARVSNGRVQSIVNTPEADCGRRPNNGNNNNNNSYRNDTESQSYNRGYNDGKYNHSKIEYSSQIQIRAYDKGYRDGREGKRKDPYYANSGNNNNNSGSDGRWRELKGRDAVSAYNSLKDRGFVELKKHTANGKTYRIWHHKRRGLCIKTLSANKRISEIMESDGCN